MIFGLEGVLALFNNPCLFFKFSSDAEDLHWGSLQENNLVAPGAWQAESLFNPVGHHPVPLALKPPNRIPEIGQFDDADE